MATENPIENIADPITEAKTEVTEALENLEDVVTDEKIKDAQITADNAVAIALNVSNESQDAIENVREELIEHEESDEWQRNKIQELTIQMDSLREELSTLKASLQPAPILSSEIPEPEIVEPIPELTPPTELEETKTEALPKSAEENPEVVITETRSNGKIRLV